MDNHPFTFQSFLPGTCNAPALEAARRAAENGTPLYLYGPTGTGKTHLLRAVEEHLSHTRPELTLVRTNADMFLAELIQAVLHARQGEFRDKYRTAHVILLDDLQFLENRETSWETFVDICKEYLADGRQVVVTADHSPRDPFFSRFPTAQLYPPDCHASSQILSAKADRMGLALEPDVLDLLAQSLPGNAHHLEGMLKRLLALRDLMDLSPTRETVAGILADRIP